MPFNSVPAAPDSVQTPSAAPSRRLPIIVSALIALLFMPLLSACSDGAAPAGDPGIVTLATHDSFIISQEVIEAFEAEHSVDLVQIGMGDAGEMLSKVILSKDAPIADVVYGIDNTILSRALEAEIFMPYRPAMLDQVSADLQLDPENRLVPIDHGYVNINADRAWYEEQDLALPSSLEDLTKPEYKDQLVVTNPASSTPGLAFLLTTVVAFGEDGYLDFWRDLKANGVLVREGWTDAYLGDFTVGSGGTGRRPMVISYSSSPPADVIFAADEREVPGSVNLNFPGGSFHQIEFAGVLAGASNPEKGKALVDFMLSEAFQSDLPEQMFMFPVNPNARPGATFSAFAEIAESPAELSPEAISEGREGWVEAWTDLMLR